MWFHGAALYFGFWSHWCCVGAGRTCHSSVNCYLMQEAGCCCCCNLICTSSAGQGGRRCCCWLLPLHVHVVDKGCLRDVLDGLFGGWRHVAMGLDGGWSAGGLLFLCMQDANEGRMLSMGGRAGVVEAGSSQLVQKLLETSQLKPDCHNGTDRAVVDPLSTPSTFSLVSAPETPASVSWWNIPIAQASGSSF